MSRLRELFRVLFMKIALVHELLTMRGGAERVFKVIADMFPDAPIYTLLYDEEKLGGWFPKNRIRTSNLQNSQLSIACPSEVRRSGRRGVNSQFRFNHHLYLAKFPQAVEAWDFSGFDLVISSSSAFAHGIITNGKPKHIGYVNSPARYLWDRTHDVQNDSSRGFFGPLKRFYLERLFHKLRIWDTEAAYRADKLLAASKTVRRRIELYWRRESDVLYPPIDDFWLAETKTTSQNPKTRNDYLVVSTLARYKKIDLAISAANSLNIDLKIAGEGPDYSRLKRIAGPTVKFLGFVPEKELKPLYKNAKATIFPGDEDFGLVPLESLACGTPVIAFKSGGALETLDEGITCKFFNDSNSESLIQTIIKFEQNIYSEVECRKQAEKFSREKFEEGIRKQLRI